MKLHKGAAMTGHRLINDKELNKYKDTILSNTIDGKDGLDNYLLWVHQNWESDNSIVLLSIYADYVSIYYMEAFNFKGHKECANFMKELYDIVFVPIYYVGKTNCLKNNSKTIDGAIHQYKPRLSYGIIGDTKL